MVARFDCKGKASDLEILTKIGVISKEKKKKRSTTAWLQNFSTCGLEIGTKYYQAMTFFFFFFLEITPIFVFGYSFPRIRRQSSL